MCERFPQLLPSERGLVRLSQVRWRTHFARGILTEEVLLDYLREDVLHVRLDLQNSILRTRCAQLVKVDLQRESIKILQRDAIERLDKILLDNQSLHFGGFWSPFRFFQ